MKRLFVVAAGAVLAGTLWAEQGHVHGKAAESKEVKAGGAATLTGEVLDLSCYLGHGATGLKHKSCAVKCLTDKHAAAGLLTKDGTVYLLVEDHEHEDAYKALIQLAGEQAKVTGKKSEKGGLKALLVEKAEKS